MIYFGDLEYTSAPAHALHITKDGKFTRGYCTRYSEKPVQKPIDACVFGGNPMQPLQITPYSLITSSSTYSGTSAQCHQNLEDYSVGCSFVKYQKRIL